MGGSSFGGGAADSYYDSGSAGGGGDGGFRKYRNSIYKNYFKKFQLKEINNNRIKKEWIKIN